VTAPGRSLPLARRPNAAATDVGPMHAAPTAEFPTAELPVVQSSVMRSAALIGIAFILSRLLGVAREIILGYQFGTSGEYDAYVAAFRVPDLLFLVIMAGSFGSAFIPIFGGMLVRGDRRGAWRLASAVINLSVLTTIAFALVCMVLAEPLVRYVVAPGLSSENRQICVDTMRVLLLSPILLGLGIAAKGILEAHHRFGLAALAPLVYNAAIIGGALALGPSLGVYGVATGVLIGALGHFVIQIPGLIHAGIRYTPRFSLRTEGLSQVGRLLLPRVIGQAAFQLNFIAVQYFASDAGEGRVSALNYAWQLMMLPHGVIALSISTVIFPTMAQLFSQGKTDELQATFGRALRPLLFLSVPAAVGLFTFRTAIVQTLFQRGEFDAASTRMVGEALVFLGLGLVFYAVVEILTRAFYAMHDTRTPVIAAVVIIVLNVALAAILVGPLDLGGLALALTVTTGIEALILLYVLQRRIGALSPEFAAWFARLALAATPMALLAHGLAARLTSATEPGVAARPLQFALLGFTLALAGGAFAVAASWLRLEELDQTLDRLSARVPVLGGAISLALGRRR